MGLSNVFSTGRSGMAASKAAIATAGHNIANANAEGFSRQRVITAAETPKDSLGSKGLVGRGVVIDRVERMNDQYLEKQIRNAGKNLAGLEEKSIGLQQAEDIFNEMGGEGLNRLMAQFFNEFRKLANDPNNEALRETVRESSEAMIQDFHRLRSSVDDVRKHLDSRLEGYVAEINSIAEEIKDANIRIRAVTLSGATPNDLLDKRDVLLKQLGSYLDLNMHQDHDGNYVVDIRGMGPLVAGSQCEKFSTRRSPADQQGKSEGALDLITSSSVQSNVTHQVRGGKVGSVLEVRDQTLSKILERLDDLAFTMSNAVNQIHQQGFTRDGIQGVAFFKPLQHTDRASQFIELSEEVKASTNSIATAAIPDAPGDNRIAIAISGLQHLPLMNNGKVTIDNYYNSMVSDVGVMAGRTRSALNQQKDIQQQLSKMRDQLSGVSIDEETTNIMQFQHAFDASARVIQVADEMLKNVIDLVRP